MSDNHDRQREDDAPAAFEPSVRVTVSLEAEAARQLEALAERLYPNKRASTARGLVLEQAVRALYRRMLAGA